jgi:hypothetical protein
LSSSFTERVKAIIFRKTVIFDGHYSKRLRVYDMVYIASGIPLFLFVIGMWLVTAGVAALLSLVYAILGALGSYWAQKAEEDR